MPMSPTRVLAVAAHPDDLEFGCGGILLMEAQKGTRMDWLICSRGESGTHGTPQERQLESEQAARLANATLHWVDMGGDAQIEESCYNALQVAAKIRELKPNLVLAPTLVENQHPDHVRVAKLVRDACRLARYGGLAPLSDTAPHAIDNLLYYRSTSTAAPGNQAKLLFDVSPVVEQWKEIMNCHATQMRGRDYLTYQLSYARLMGLECGVEYALPLFSEDSLLLPGFSTLLGSSRRF